MNIFPVGANLRSHHFREVHVPHRLLAKFKLLILLAILFALSACAAARPPLTGIVPGRAVETLQSSINVSAKAGKETSSGRGFLVFKRPDRFHLALLNPFGLALFEIFGDADRFTCLVPSRQVAYAGLLSELPPESAFKSLAMMAWVVAPPGAEHPGEVVSPSGERVVLDRRGLVSRKVSPLGDEVSYHDYLNANGVAFPESIVIRSRFGATVKIVFDEPEVNEPLEESALVPALEGYRVLPLSEFRGM